jgi:hypothetical protein
MRPMRQMKTRRKTPSRTKSQPHKIAAHKIAAHKIAAHKIAAHKIAAHKIAAHKIAVNLNLYLFVLLFRKLYE